MCNAYTAAERAARAPGDDAVALKELNRRSLHVCPSGHKTEDIPAFGAGGVIVWKQDPDTETICVAAHFGGNAISTGETTILVHLEQSRLSRIEYCPLLAFRSNFGATDHVRLHDARSMINITSAKPRSAKPNAKIRKWVEQALPAQYEDVTVMVTCFDRRVQRPEPPC